MAFLVSAFLASISFCLTERKKKENCFDDEEEKEREQVREKVVALNLRVQIDQFPSKVMREGVIHHGKRRKR